MTTCSSYVTHSSYTHDDMIKILKVDDAEGNSMIRNMYRSLTRRFKKKQTSISTSTVTAFENPSYGLESQNVSSIVEGIVDSPSIHQHSMNHSNMLADTVIYTPARRSSAEHVSIHIPRGESYPTFTKSESAIRPLKLASVISTIKRLPVIVRKKQIMQRLSSVTVPKVVTSKVSHLWSKTVSTSSTKKEESEYVTLYALDELRNMYLQLTNIMGRQVLLDHVHNNGGLWYTLPKILRNVINTETKVCIDKLSERLMKGDVADDELFEETYMTLEELQTKLTQSLNMPSNLYIYDRKNALSVNLRDDMVATMSDSSVIPDVPDLRTFDKNVVSSSDTMRLRKGTGSTSFLNSSTLTKMRDSIRHRVTRTKPTPYATLEEPCHEEVCETSFVDPFEDIGKKNITYLSNVPLSPPKQQNPIESMADLITFNI